MSAPESHCKNLDFASEEDVLPLNNLSRGNMVLLAF